MHILITGGAGFLGSHLTKRLLKEDHKVTVIDNFLTGSRSNLPKDPDLTVIDKDVCDISYHTLHGLRKINQIYHLASPASPNHHSPLSYHSLPMETMMVNTTGTLRMLEFARARGIHDFVFASSSSVYGDDTPVPFSESARADLPISPYAASKRACELYCATYAHLYGLKIAALRFFTVYGPRQRPDLAIHKFAKLILAGQPITLFGDGSTERDYTYVEKANK
jgi:UDP-glucuronate 4-epimerase